MIIYYGNNGELIHLVSLISFIGNIFSLDQNSKIVAGLVSYPLIYPMYICLASPWILVVIICPSDLSSNSKTTGNVQFNILNVPTPQHTAFYFCTFLSTIRY